MLRANLVCAQVSKTVLMCARSHEMHLSNTDRHFYRRSALLQGAGEATGEGCNWDHTQLLFHWECCSVDRTLAAAAEAPSSPTPTTTALFLGNQIGQQTARVNHTSTATLVGQSHSWRELRGAGQQHWPAARQQVPGVHLVTRHEPPGETSASSLSSVPLPPSLAVPLAAHAGASWASSL